MANLAPNAGKDGVYEITTLDIVKGATTPGSGGIANDPHQNLLNRSELLYDLLDGTISNGDLSGFGDIQIMADDGASGTEILMHFETGSAANIGIGTITPAADRKLDLTTSLVNGLHGTSSNVSGRGVIGEVTGATGAIGVYGRNLNGSGGTTYGGYFLATVGTAGGYGVRAEGSTYGIYGLCPKTGAITNYGGDFLAKGDTGIGVKGSVDATTGVNYGGRFSSVSTSTGAAGVYGTSTAASGTTYGVHGVSLTSTSGTGVRGEGGSIGTSGTTLTATGIGVSGFADHASGACIGVKGVVANSTSLTAYAVQGINNGAGFGGYFESTESTGVTHGCFAKRSSSDGGAYHFMAFDTTRPYGNTSGRYLKVGKKNVNILNAIRDYDDWDIKRYSSKINSDFDTTISPMADQFNSAFDFSNWNEDSISLLNIAGVAFGGVVQLVEEIDELKKEIKKLKEKK